MLAEGLTVSVGYAVELALVLPAWLEGLARVFVVTAPDDEATLAVCSSAGPAVVPIVTDAFTRNDASFDKGGALAEAYRGIQWAGEWRLLFDADILPPRRWAGALDGAECGNLYGAPRYQCDDLGDIPRADLRRIPDPADEMPGFFWLFHKDDPHLPGPDAPMFSSWKHAGCYDTEFKARWCADSRRRLDIRLLHLGAPGRNWWGVGEGTKMATMYQERRERGGYQHERIADGVAVS